MKSKEILPVNKRYKSKTPSYSETRLLYKALEAAEKENIELQDKLTQCQLYNHSINAELQDLKQKNN